MWTLLLGLALAEEPPPTPLPDLDAPPNTWTSAYLSSGVIAGGLGFVLGVSGDTRSGHLKAMGELAVGGRTQGITGGIPDKPGIVLGSVGVVVDYPERNGLRLGLMALADIAVVDAAEEDCEGQGGCRHYLFVRAEGVPVGMAVAPAAGIAIEQAWRSGARVTATVAVQDHRIYTVRLPGPRGEVMVTTASGWELGTWLRRHGIGLRVGYALGRHRDADDPSTQ